MICKTPKAFLNETQWCLMASSPNMKVKTYKIKDKNKSYETDL